MRSIAVMLLAVVGSGSVQADEPRWYAGLSAGTTSSDVRDRQLNAFARNALSSAGLNVQSTGSSSLDDSDATWSIVGGYKISRYFAIEAAYVDLGSTKYRYAGEAGRVGGFGIPPLLVSYQPASSTVSVDSSGFALRGMGIAPIADRFNVHAHLGAFIANTEITVSGGTPSRSFSGTADEDSQNLTYGIGVGYQFHNRWMLSVDWQRYAGLGVDRKTIDESLISFTESDIDGDVDSLTFSVLLTF